MLTPRAPISSTPEISCKETATGSWTQRDFCNKLSQIQWKDIGQVPLQKLEINAPHTNATAKHT